MHSKNLTLLTDLYELTMMQGYYDKQDNPTVIFDVFYRSNPFSSGFAIAAGLEQVIEYVKNLNFSYDDVDYRSRDLQHISTHMVQVETSRKLTDKTAGFLVLKDGVQDWEAVNDSAYYYAAQTGVKTWNTEKLSLKAGAGVQLYDRPSGQSDETGFSFDGSAGWLATDKIELQAGARNGIQLSPFYENNAAQFMIFWVGGKYQASETVNLLANMVYRMDDYLDPVTSADGAVVDREDKGFAIRVRANYQMPFQPLKVYAELSHELTDSNLGDYDRTRAGLGLNFVF